MATKKNVFITVLVFLMIAATISAGVVGRGGFGAGVVLAASEAEDPTSRPVQRWQTLDANELADCPCVGEEGEFDAEAFAAWQAERAALREEVQRQSMRSSKGRAGRTAVTATSNGSNRASMQNRAVNKRSAQPVGGSSYGPAWAR